MQRLAFLVPKCDLMTMFLLGYFSQEKTEAKSGINAADLQDSETEDKDNTPGPTANNENISLDEADDDQKDIIREATKKIYEEINRLKAKYMKFGNTVHNSEGTDNADVKLKDSASVQDDKLGPETIVGNHDKEYAMLVMKLNDAADELLLLRSKLAAEYKSGNNEESQNNEEEEGKGTKTAEKWLKVHRLLTKLFDLESSMQEENNNKDKNEEDDDSALDSDEEMLNLIALESLHSKNRIGSENTGYGGAMLSRFHHKKGLARVGAGKLAPVERDWHTKGCSEFKEPCLGWFPDCCESSQMGKIRFNMCCSFSSYNLKGKDKLSGICIPNAYGTGQCVQRRP